MHNEQTAKKIVVKFIWSVCYMLREMKLINVSEITVNICILSSLIAL